jgi:cyclopropane fatty-acyl-phospholipid synthase-like methyltransferase
MAGPMYGEITQHSMHKILEYLATHCHLGSDSMFLDVGSGVGKPSIHAAQYPGVRLSFGIETQQLRWQVSEWIQREAPDLPS